MYVYVFYSIQSNLPSHFFQLQRVADQNTANIGADREFQKTSCFAKLTEKSWVFSPEYKQRVTFYSIGVNDVFGHSGTADDWLKELGLTSENIVQKSKEILCWNAGECSDNCITSVMRDA